MKKQVVYRSRFHWLLTLWKLLLSHHPEQKRSCSLSFHIPAAHSRRNPFRVTDVKTPCRKLFEHRKFRVSWSHFRNFVKFVQTHLCKSCISSSGIMDLDVFQSDIFDECIRHSDYWWRWNVLAYPQPVLHNCSLHRLCRGYFCIHIRYGDVVHFPFLAGPSFAYPQENNIPVFIDLRLSTTTFSTNRRRQQRRWCWPVSVEHKIVYDCDITESSYDAVPNLCHLRLSYRIIMNVNILADKICRVWFKAYPSSAASKYELVTLTLSQSTMSIPSLFQYDLLSTIILSITTFLHWSYCWFQLPGSFSVTPSILIFLHPGNRYSGTYCLSGTVIFRGSVITPLWIRSTRLPATSNPSRRSHLCP